VWQILVSQFAGRQKKPPTIVTTDLTYDELCDTHTDYHHAISIDLGKVVSPEVKKSIYPLFPHRTYISILPLLLVGRAYRSAGTRESTPCLCCQRS